MTRLLAPNPGEVADRQTILKLKIKFALSNRVPGEHFSEELGALDDYLAEHWHKEFTAQTRSEFLRLHDDLLKVNKKLWDAEDEIRLIRNHGGIFVAGHSLLLSELAVIITEQNDVRSNLVRQINALYGINQQEKLYQCATTK
jgi:hypothetical protein